MVNIKEHYPLKGLFGLNQLKCLLLTLFMASFTKHIFYSKVTFSFFFITFFPTLIATFSKHAPPSIPVAMPRLTSGL